MTVQQATYSSAIKTFEKVDQRRKQLIGYTGEALGHDTSKKDLVCWQRNGESGALNQGRSVVELEDRSWLPI